MKAARRIPLLDSVLDLFGLGYKAHARWLALFHMRLAPTYPNWPERLPIKLVVSDKTFDFDPRSGRLTCGVMRPARYEPVGDTTPTIDVSGERRLIGVLVALRRLGVPSGVVVCTQCPQPSDATAHSPTLRRQDRTT